MHRRLPSLSGTEVLDHGAISGPFSAGELVQVVFLFSSAITINASHQSLLYVLLMKERIV